MAGSLLSMLIPSRGVEAAAVGSAIAAESGDVAVLPAVAKALPSQAKAGEGTPFLPAFEAMLGEAEKMIAPVRASQTPAVQNIVDNIKARVGEGDFSPVPIAVPQDTWLQSAGGDEVVAVVLPEIGKVEAVQMVQVAVFEPVVMDDVEIDIDAVLSQNKLDIEVVEPLIFEGEDVAPLLEVFMEGLVVKSSVLPVSYELLVGEAVELPANIVAENVAIEVSVEKVISADSQAGALAYEIVQEIADELNLDMEILPATAFYPVENEVIVKPEVEILLPEVKVVVEDKVTTKIEDIVPLTNEAVKVLSKKVDVEAIKPVVVAEGDSKSRNASEVVVHRDVADEVIEGDEANNVVRVDLPVQPRVADVKVDKVVESPVTLSTESVVNADVSKVVEEVKYQNVDITIVAEKTVNVAVQHTVVAVEKPVLDAVDKSVKKVASNVVKNVADFTEVDLEKESIAVIEDPVAVNIELAQQIHKNIEVVKPVVAQAPIVDNIADRMTGAANRLVADLPEKNGANKIVDDLSSGTRPLEQFDSRGVAAMPKGLENFAAKLVDMPAAALNSPVLESILPEIENMVIGTDASRFTNVRGVEQADAQTRLFNAPEQLPVNDQISVNIKQAMANGTDEIRIRLHPAELGMVDVKMEISADGKTTVIVMLEKAETLDMMQKDSRSLQQALADAGLDVETGGLQFSMSGDGEAGGESQAQEDNADAAGAYGKTAETVDGADALDIAEVIDGDDYTLVASDGVDIKV